MVGRAGGLERAPRLCRGGGAERCCGRKPTGLGSLRKLCSMETDGTAFRSFAAVQDGAPCHVSILCVYSTCLCLAHTLRSTRHDGLPRMVTTSGGLLRGLNALPGEWSTSVDVEPPLSKAAADELHKSLPFGLPSPLHDLYTTGSRSCRCTYYWSPDEAYLPLVEKVLPCQHSLDGGARFLPAAELNNAHASRADGPSDGTRQAMSSRGWPRRFSSRSNWMSNQCRQPVHACRRPGRFSSR